MYMAIIVKHLSLLVYISGEHEQDHCFLAFHKMNFLGHVLLTFASKHNCYAKCILIMKPLCQPIKNVSNKMSGFTL